MVKWIKNKTMNNHLIILNQSHRFQKIFRKINKVFPFKYKIKNLRKKLQKIKILHQNYNLQITVQFKQIKKLKMMLIQKIKKKLRNLTFNNLNLQ